ncbi:hypothetical protein [Fimbriiglobus ruber]|uniref:Uncharacterized protein n=1 Tax=Fimbriiglobus ruber TaxID=1908690 RepID=A0A225E9Q3_9BACT|nr:hypothetical protein [Fimbriiglobus ruber]OWK45305.1 hypothetical protein FRUB_01636 [Fimbriiglobus ruber]
MSEGEPTSRPLVDRIADAVLYEGYLLYPYRPTSVKNRQRWTFGGLFPQDCELARAADEPSSLQTECLVEGGSEATVRIRVRFLHLVTRLLHHADGRRGPAWQEAEDRGVEVDIPGLGASEGRHEFSFPRRQVRETLRGPTGDDIGEVVRDQSEVRGAVEWQTNEVAAGLVRLTVRVVNLTEPEHPAGGREELLPVSLVSTHVILEAGRGGAFVSLFDPPDALREAVAGCMNVGVWPVLVGGAGARDTLLASPIILYDYPEIAPESPGDLFDATEIDEILTLRILTMTDDEKREMRAADPRADALLARTEALTGDDLMRLHGTLRGVKPAAEEHGYR